MKTRRRPATPAESARALAQVQALFAMTPRDRLELRLQRAKAGMTAAAQAIIDASPDAERLATDALEEFTAAQAALRLLDAPPQGEAT